MKSSTSRKHNEHPRAFLESGKVEQTAPRIPREQDEMRQAEAEGRAHPQGQANAASSPGRPKPDKKAPGKHPQGRNPDPRKLPGR